MHQASKQAATAAQTVTGLHRAADQATTQPAERWHVPVKDRLRPRRGLQTIATGPRVREGSIVAQAIRRGDVIIGDSAQPATLHQHSYQPVAAFRLLAADLCLAG